MTLRTKTLGVIGVSMAMLFATGCGGTSEKAADSQTSAAQTECVKKATEMRDGLRGDVPLELMPNFDMAKNKGKTVWVLNAARVPFLQQISDGVEAAGKAAGMTTKVLYGDGTTNASNAAIQQATAQKVDGIILVVIDPATVKPALEQAKAAGIKVIDVINRTSNDVKPDYISGDAVINGDRSAEGLVSWILADSKCKAETIIYRPSALPITLNMMDVAADLYKKMCPSCEIAIEEMNYGTYSTTLAPRIATDIRRKPDTSYLIPIIGSAIPFADAALRDLGPAGSKIKMATHDGLVDNLNAMREGKTQEAADTAFIPAESIGWLTVDQIARLMAAEAGAERVLMPTRLIDKTNVGASQDEMWPKYQGYQDAYKGAWGF